MIPPRSRLLIGLAAGLLALVVIGAILQAVRSLLWDLSYLLPGWLLTPVLLLAVGLILALGIQIGWPWGQSWQRRKRRPDQTTEPQIQVPSDRREAATRSLDSIERVLEQLQDDITREGLRRERQRVAEDLTRGDLVVAVFGSGSSGKTSLIRALLQEMVGEVAAAMGSTQHSRTYRLKLRGLQRGLQLVDTPGILEAGDAGYTREETARRVAVRSDLLLVVVDGDLRASEFGVLQSIADLGKRLLLVLNKRDLRGVEEERRLLEVLRHRCRGLVEELDVIACSASPQSIPRPGGQPLQPAPD